MNMDVPSEAMLLEAWRQAEHGATAQRDAVILAAAHPGQTVGHFTQMSVGRSDAAVIRLYQLLFGDRVEGLTTCPDCSQELEFTVPLASLQVPMEETMPESLDVHEEGYSVQFRLPTATDLSAVNACETVDAAQALLLESCICTAEHEGKKVLYEQLPADVKDCIEQAMAAADPQGDVSLLVQCAFCRHQWRASFDASRFLWHALEAWGLRILHEVHKLAMAYGWSESEILAVSPWRRQHYLSMVQT